MDPFTELVPKGIAAKWWAGWFACSLSTHKQETMEVKGKEVENVLWESCKAFEDSGIEAKKKKEIRKEAVRTIVHTKSCPWPIIRSAYTWYVSSKLRRYFNMTVGSKSLHKSVQVDLSALSLYVLNFLL